MSLSQYTTQEDPFSQDMPYARSHKRARRSGTFFKNRRSVYIPRKTRRRLGAVRINDTATHTLTPPMPLGDPTKNVQLVYSSGLLSLTADAAGNFYRTFRGNGPWDPDATGVGQQPKFWDAFASLYYEHFVKASEIEVIVSPGASTTGPGICVLCPASGSAGAAYDARTMGESPYAVQSLIGNNTDSFRLNGYMTTYSMLGIDGSNSADIALTSTVPAADASWYWNIQGTCDALAIVNISVRIKYTIEFRNVKWDIAS